MTDSSDAFGVGMAIIILVAMLLFITALPFPEIAKKLLYFVWAICLFSWIIYMVKH